MNENVRKPAVAGQFYEGTKSYLEESIRKCFLDVRGPGLLPKIEKGKQSIKGLVVPHAGYFYSGAIASHAYHYLAKNGFAETFVILGPNHSGMGSGVSIMTEGIWRTPLGDVPINQHLAKYSCKDIIDRDDAAHRYEHSIEVQLPFLQYCAKNNPFSFVPICMSMQDAETAEEIGKIISEAIQQTKQMTVIIASSDFTHTGFNYMNMPTGELRVDQFAKKQDELAIKKILEMDPKGLIMTISDHNISMCGFGPVAAMMVAAKLLGATKAELLRYGTSYEVQPGTSCVGYGALCVY